MADCDYSEYASVVCIKENVTDGKLKGKKNPHFYKFFSDGPVTIIT
jgi:hypothetical protein